MRTSKLNPLARAMAGLVATTLVGGWLLAETAPAKAPRGEPIKPAGVRGEPIKPAAPSATPAPAAVAPAPGAANATAEVQVVGFDKLSGFPYVAPEYSGTNPPPLPDTNQIPASVRAYDGKKVAVKGFMLPLKVQEGKVTELILLRDQSMCCFGSVPKLNEFVTVKMTGGGTRAVMDQAVTLVGKLKVGEFTENGYLLGIYQMEGERAEGPGLH